MVRPRVRKRSLCGVEVTSQDGVAWGWILDGIQYSWCKLGQLRAQTSQGTRVVMFSRSLDGAVGYTAGYHDAKGFAQRGNGDKVE